MTFTPSEVILGASVPLENGGTVSLSIAGHVEAERDYDDAVVIFARKLLKYTNSASDADRLTVRQIISSITSTPLDKVPDVGAGAPIPPPMEPAKTPLGSLPKKQDSGKAWVGEDDGRVLRLDKSAKTSSPAADVTLDQGSPLPKRMPAPSAAEAVSRQQHADKLMVDLGRLQADHNARVAASKPAAVQIPDTSAPKAPTAAEQAAAAVRSIIKPPAAPQPVGSGAAPVPTAPPEPEASAPAEGPTAPPTPKPAPAEDLCERCGASVSKSQAKLSQLFMSKTLCKPCMEAP